MILNNIYPGALPDVLPKYRSVTAGAPVLNFTLAAGVRRLMAPDPCAVLQSAWAVNFVKVIRTIEKVIRTIEHQAVRPSVESE
jgi:hypothetical protein